MPVVLRYTGYRFFFYSNEGSLRKSAHIPVRGEGGEGGEGGEAKFWVRPDVRVVDSNGFDARNLRKLTRVVETCS